MQRASPFTLSNSSTELPRLTNEATLKTGEYRTSAKRNLGLALGAPGNNLISHLSSRPHDVLTPLRLAIIP